MVDKAKTFLSVDVSEDTKRELKIMGMKENRTLSDLVREAISEYLEKKCEN